jgi:hypothetical protein
MLTVREACGGGEAAAATACGSAQHSPDLLLQLHRAGEMAEPSERVAAVRRAVEERLQQEVGATACGVAQHSPDLLLQLHRAGDQAVMSKL